MITKRADAVLLQVLDSWPTTVHLALFSGSGSFDADVREAIRRGEVLGFAARNLY